MSAITKDRIAEAVCAADDGIGRAGDLPAYCHERRIDAEGLSHVAMQRGLRMLMVERGLDPSKPPSHLMLTPDEQVRQLRYAAQWMDGFCAARVLADEGV